MAHMCNIKVEPIDEGDVLDHYDTSQRTYNDTDIKIEKLDVKNECFDDQDFVSDSSQLTEDAKGRCSLEICRSEV